jgi:hypothetical protein
MRAIEFSLIVLLSAFLGGGCVQIPQPRYTIILIPMPESVADSADDGRGSEEVIPPGQSKHDSQATSGSLSEPHLHPAELSIER